MPKAPTPSEFDEYAAHYEEALQRGLSLTGEDKDFFAAGRINWLRRQIGRLGQKPISCLDFGCGTGTAASYLHDGLGIESYVGFDPSAASIERAQLEKSFRGAIFTCDPASIEPESADLAFCNGVFHHIPIDQRTAATKLVWNALKPGGIFAFWENNRWNPIVHYMMSKVPFDDDAQMLFPHQARDLLKAAGFTILSTDYLFIFPSVLRALRPLETFFSKLPLGGQYMVLARKD
jgi:SAM-dependent methyltransferase